jgi:hypothetical protein
MFHGNGWKVNEVEKELLENPLHAHLRYHKCRRPELYKIYERPPKGASTRSSSRNADGYVTGDKGQILVNNSGNIREALRRLRVTLRHNDFANVNEIHGLPGFDGELTDAGAPVSTSVTNKAAVVTENKPCPASKINGGSSSFVAFGLRAIDALIAGAISWGNKSGASNRASP